MEDRVLVSVKNLKKYFPRGKALVHAVEDVSFDIRKGETLGLVGESGCGKSTIARLIIRLINPDGGKIIFDSVDITNLSERALKPFRRRMQIVFQDPASSLNPQMTVGTIIREQFAIHNIGTRQEQEKWVEELLERVGLDPSLKDAYSHEFSGGQQQRICIARAIALKSEFIVCDEPLSALDVSVQAQIIKLLEELQKELGLTYLFISHDLAVVKHLSDSIAVMYLGKLVEYANKEELFDNPLHPYTITLLSSVPSIKGKEEELELKGEPPNPINPPRGCPFNPRCPNKIDICERETPTLDEVSDGHFVACHIASGRR